jgi:hypothetical protein
LSIVKIRLWLPGRFVVVRSAAVSKKCCPLQARRTGPTGVRRLVGIADEIARIAGHRRRAAVMPMSL